RDIRIEMIQQAAARFVVGPDSTVGGEGHGARNEGTKPGGGVVVVQPAVGPQVDAGTSIRRQGIHVGADSGRALAGERAIVVRAAVAVGAGHPVVNASRTIGREGGNPGDNVVQPGARVEVVQPAVGPQVHARPGVHGDGINVAADLGRVLAAERVVV